MRLGDSELTIPCPQCGYSFKIKLSATAEGSQTRCPRCGIVFRGKGDGVDQAQRAIDSLTRSFRRLGGG